ncbi:MAG: uncharacterized protein QOC62_4693 [Mycobacterium sp.]|nr:uncharacterized protein [Mycobacterium sp.]
MLTSPTPSKNRTGCVPDHKISLKRRSRGAAFRFRLTAGNGEIIAVGEAYEYKAAAKNGIASVQKNAADAKIDDLTEVGAARCQRRSGSSRACACAASTTVDSLGAGRRRAHRSQPLPAMLPLLISPICATVELTTTLFGQCGACRLNSIDAEGNSCTGAAKFRFKRLMEGLTTTHNWVRRAHLN